MGERQSHCQFAAKRMSHQRDGAGEAFLQPAGNVLSLAVETETHCPRRGAMIGEIRQVTGRHVGQGGCDPGEVLALPE
jgi:hypothetical protein